MSLMTRDRLPRSGQQVDRGREIRLGVLGMLGLLALVVGIPAALVLFVGYPLPRSAPSKDWLTESVSATFLINLLACVVWLVWAHFVVCLISEWRALRRGRLPSHVPLGGGSQLLARRLVAAALLLSGAATVIPHHSGGHVPAPRPAVVAVQHVAAPAPEPAAETPVEHNAAAHADHRLKYYVVQPPHGRRYDSLWDIAERTLKDPLRYKEIFALNKDRTQADGRTLVDANLIMPGWELRLPGDASGPGVHEVPVAPQPVHRHEQPVPAVPPSHEVAHAQAAAPAHEDGWSVEATLIGGGLMLAGVLAALNARRGPYAQETDDDVATLADPGRAAVLDRELRALAAARSAQGRALPHPVLGWLADDHITLTLAGGDVADPPLPWTGDSHSWLLPLSEAGGPPLPDVAAPYPGLLAVGRTSGQELFIDVEQAPGVIGIGGDAERAREFVLALAAQAATCVWSDGAHVTMAGFGGNDQLAPFAITHVDRLADVLTDIEAQQADVVKLQQRLGVDGVLTGRQVRRDDAWRPHIVVLSGLPTPDEERRLQLLAAGRSRVVVIVVGTPPTAQWRFVMGADGMLDLGVLGVSVQAHRLTDTSRDRLVELLAEGAAGRPQRNAEVAALTPATAAAAVPEVPVRRDVPAAAWLSMLGPVAVNAPGPLPDGFRDLATEIVVAVALHPEGMHEAVLSASIWPRGVTDDVLGAAMANVMAWLGTDQAGRPCLAKDGDGLWRISDAVRIDWAELRDLAARATGPSELHTLQAGIELFRGEAFSGTPAGRYGWLAFARSARDARIVATTVTRRAAQLLTGQRQTADAIAVLRRGLVLVPTSELLWRDLLTLSSWDGPDGAATVADEMYRTLQAHRVWPEPQTDALVAQVAPGYAAG